MREAGAAAGMLRVAEHEGARRTMTPGQGEVFYSGNVRGAAVSALTTMLPG